MDSSKLTRRIGAMAFSILLAVLTLRLTFLVHPEAASFYMTSLVNTFEEILTLSNPVRGLVWIITSIGLGFAIKRYPYSFIYSLTTVALLFILGSWINTVLYSSIGYNPTSIGLVVLTSLNVLLSTIASALPLAVISVFITQILRPV